MTIMAEEITTQNLMSLVTFVQLKIRIYLETADKKLDNYDNVASNFGMSAAEAVRELKKVDSSLFLGLPRYDDGLRSYVIKWVEDPDPNFIGLAELYARFSLSVEDVEILAW